MVSERKVKYIASKMLMEVQDARPLSTPPHDSPQAPLT